jgi:hypothetical protein
LNRRLASYRIRSGIRSGIRSAAMIALAMVLAACSQELSLEQQVIANIRNMEAHIEAGERREFMNYVAEDFFGQGGEFNHDQLNALLLYQLRRHKRVHAQIFPVQVLPAGVDEAEARFRVLLTGGEGFLPDTGQLYDVVSYWQWQEGEWRLRSAQWESSSAGNL